MCCEPLITIWGKEITRSQSMTIRVAIESFACSLNEEGLGDDLIGKEMTKSYKKNINELRGLIFGESNYGAAGNVN